VQERQKSEETGDEMEEEEGQQVKTEEEEV
jgi:hypothetical protein